MPQVTFKIEKQAPTISVTNGNSDNLELFHGIGNTLGFNITGGADFAIPITIFHVKEGSRAENAGLKLGDSIVAINDNETNNMTLQEANNLLEQAAQQDVKLGVLKFDEVDEANPNKKPEVHNVVLTGSINVESTIKSMQRQLLQIADKIPDDVMLTLLKSFAKILSRDPEPLPRTPFIRAFTKIRDDGIAKSFYAIAEENEEQLKDYEEGSSDIEPDCSFNYKVTTTTQNVVYAVGNNDRSYDSANEVIENGAISSENEEIFENVDEGIELEMPPLLPADDDSSNDFEKLVDQVDENCDGQERSEIENEVTEVELEDVDLTETSTEIIEEPEEIPEPEPEPIIEPEPMEAPKVSLDDIQREINDMQNFLRFKGVGVESEKRPAPNIVRDYSSNSTEPVNTELFVSRNNEDAYNLDVCISLKNRDSQKHRSHKKHHHDKYKLSENYKEEVIEDGPIFDPTVPNTVEDFMKIKTFSEKTSRKKQQAESWDASWQNLCENKKHLYRHSQFEKSKKNVEEQQRNIKFY